MNGIGNRMPGVAEMLDNVRILEAFEARLKKGKPTGTHLGKKKGAAK